MLDFRLKCHFMSAVWRTLWIASPFGPAAVFVYLLACRISEADFAGMGFLLALLSGTAAGVIVSLGVEALIVRSSYIRLSDDGVLRAGPLRTLAIPWHEVAGWALVAPSVAMHRRPVVGAFVYGREWVIDWFWGTRHLVLLTARAPVDIGPTARVRDCERLLSALEERLGPATAWPPPPGVRGEPR